MYNYFPNLGIESINDKEEYKNASIIHFAGGPKPWNTQICFAKKFNAIPEWWSNAIEVGATKKLPYVRCFLNNFFKYLLYLLVKIKVFRLIITKVSEMIKSSLSAK